MTPDQPPMVAIMLSAAPCGKPCQSKDSPVTRATDSGFQHITEIQIRQNTGFCNLFGFVDVCNIF